MSSIHDFVNALHASHLDNGRMVYYAAKAGTSASRSKIKPVMPATPFIFEYFLYNSIYQHDWIYSDKSGHLVSHGDANRKRGDEGEQQTRLLDEYLRPQCQKQPELLQRAFAPLKYLIDIKGSWTEILTDDKLNDKRGAEFFESVLGIQRMIESDLSPESTITFFEQLHICRSFIGQVRNNIFHGRKSLDQIWNKNQSRRIELYYLLIQSINSLFFLVRCMKEVASDEVCHPIKIPSVPNPILLSSMEVLELRVEGMMKKEDPELIPWVNERLNPMRDSGDPSGAMFSPSAGADIITPVLIGLPFCTEFHFYDDGGAGEWRKALRYLRNILGNPSGLKLPDGAKRNVEVEFEYNGITRRIFFVKADNESFLDSPSRLICFFHRGDGTGEGGSNQPWDGEWFARWRAMIPDGKLCAVLTDGFPHGLNAQLEPHLTQHPKLRGPKGTPYYCGIIHSTTAH